MARTETQAVIKSFRCRACVYEETCKKMHKAYICTRFEPKEIPVQRLSRYDILLGREGRYLPQKPLPPEGRTVYE